MRVAQPSSCEGTPATDVFTIKSGTVKLFKLLANGRRQIVGFLSAGEVFGFVPGETYTASAEAINTVRVLRFPRQQLERMFAEVPGLERQFLDLMARELAAAHDQIVLLGRKTAPKRVASFLLMLAERQNVSDGWIDLLMTRADIADYLGLTLETVSRTFAVLRGTGCIAERAYNAQRCRILDRNVLAELANSLARGA